MKLIHCADLHFDTPFSGLSGRRADIRREDLRATFGRIVELTLAEQADALLIAGDLFDSAQISSQTLRYLHNQLMRLGEIPVLICGGNHDPLTADSCYRTMNWPENVHIFAADRMERVDLPGGVCVYGRSFADRYQISSMLTGFHVEDAAKINIMLLHGQLAGAGQTNEYNPLYADDIAASGLCYLALGHVHQPSEAQRADDTVYAYSGCPEGRGFDELDDRGVLVVETDGTEVSLRFVPVCRRKYRHITVEVSGMADNQELLEAMRGAVEQTEDIYKFTLTGAAEFAIQPAVLSDGLELFGVKMVDETHPAVDLEALAAEQTLRGMFVKQLLASEDAELAQQAIAYGLAALDGEKVTL